MEKRHSLKDAISFSLSLFQISQKKIKILIKSNVGITDFGNILYVLFFFSSNMYRKYKCVIFGLYKM